VCIYIRPFPELSFVLPEARRSFSLTFHGIRGQVHLTYAQIKIQHFLPTKIQLQKKKKKSLKINKKKNISERKIC
jgi:hypothetical protein